MRVCDFAQRTQAWNDAHAGKLTGSRSRHVWKERQRGKGELEGRATLRGRIVSERLTGRYSDSLGPYLPEAMQRGVDLEPMAFAAYEALTGTLVERVGFIEHDSLLVGCSPDGVVYATDGSIVGGVELKCPDSHTHLSYLQAGGVPEEYVGQVLHNLWLAEAQWWDFVSFDDRFLDPDHQLFRVRVTRSSPDLPVYEAKAREFLAEVDRDYSIAVGKQWQRAAAALVEAR